MRHEKPRTRSTYRTSHPGIGGLRQVRRNQRKSDQTRESHKCHGQNPGRDQRNGNALERLGYVLEIEAFADTREEHQREGETGFS